MKPPGTLSGKRDAAFNPERSDAPAPVRIDRDRRAGHVETYARATAGRIIRSFTEVESGKRNDRPELAKAIAQTQRTNARLVITRLDRLSRNAASLLNLMESQA